MPLKFVLNDTMLRHNITQKELAEFTGVRPNTIQDIREGAPKALTVEKLNALIAGISKMSGQTYGIEAVMVYVEDSE